MEIANLAAFTTTLLLPLVIWVTESKESLHIYVMSRLYLDFILAHDRQVLESSPTFSSWRKNLTADIAKYSEYLLTASIKSFALSWKGSQDVDQTYRDDVYSRYKKELEFSLAPIHPRVSQLTTHHLFSSNGATPQRLPRLQYHFERTTCNLVGVVDWAEAEIAPSGLNLYSQQRLISQIRLKFDLPRFDEYVTLENIFWRTFSVEAGGLGDDTITAIEAARIQECCSLVALQVVLQIWRSQYPLRMMKVEHITCVIWMGC
ncbi:hypothetical protein N7532_005763 [Penicillium argentinense]|uniref:Aminoglycoside phosphotransferase domain-containing protein n=1 Tax=Penicillium argentinense TaxID=1131581 RepID=A0A9W9KB97_9EURO|nr:uncharacterized protein N7532_005763 [Penicillium argentinense]KAJ5098762.1 hypothetical protein N7532_005763 [Penicillium argentinense]